MKLTIRKADKKDIEFITEGIIHAEMSGSSILPYQTLFELSLEETRTLIQDVMDEEIEGQ